MDPALVATLVPESPLRMSIFMLLVGAVLLMVIKPDFMYGDDDDRFLPFGTGPGQTLMPFWLAVTLIGVVGYYLSFAINQ